VVALDRIRYQAVSVDDHAAAAAGGGVPGPVVELLTYLFSEASTAATPTSSRGVRQALGRAPTEFADYARRTAATGVWSS
jgi:hypothetical protein